MTTSLRLRIIALSLGIASPLVYSGCTATNQAVSSVRGEVKGLLSASLEDAYHATDTTVEEMKFQKLQSVCDVLSGLITCSTAENKKIEIRLRREADKIVSISIQVGAFGDERIANAILEKVKKRL